MIKEARQRRRRRRAGLAGVSGLVLAGVIFGLVSGGGPPGGQGRTGGGSGGAPSSASWRELTAPGGYIAPGAAVRDIVSFHGELVAVGYQTATVQPASCVGCAPTTRDPVVWVSRDGASWRRVFAARPAGNSSANERLVPTSTAVFLYNGTQHDRGPDDRLGTELWRSTNLRVWRRLTVPRPLATPDSQVQIAPAGRRVIASVGPRAWTTTDGVDWARLNLPDQPHLLAIAVAGTGRVLRAEGVSSDGSLRFWTSADGGASWALYRPPKGRRIVQLTRGPRGIAVVSSGTPAHTSIYWQAPGGGSWHRSRALGHGLAASPQSAEPVIYPLSGGFLAVQGDATLNLKGVSLSSKQLGPPKYQWWWSANGRVFSPLAIKTPTSANASVATLLAVNGSLILVEQMLHANHGIPAGAITFWRFDLPASHNG